MKSMQYVLMLALSIISGFLGGVLSVWFLMPPSVLAQDESPKVITAERIEIVDENGAKRLILLAGGIALADPDGTIRVSLYENVEGGAGFLVYDEQQKRRVRLALANSSVGSLQFYDDTGEEMKASLGVTNGGASLNLYGGKVMLGSGLEGTVLRLSAQEGNSRFTIGIVKSDQPRVVLQDEEGKVVWSAP